MYADALPDEPSDLEPDLSEPAEPSDLDFTDMPCTDEAGQGSDESKWEAFLPDDDEWDPEPEQGDFWIEGISADPPAGTLLFPLHVSRSPRLLVLL